MSSYASSHLPTFLPSYNKKIHLFLQQRKNKDRKIHTSQEGLSVPYLLSSHVSGGVNGVYKSFHHALQ